MNNLLDHNTIIVDEKITFFFNRYRLLDIEGHEIGMIKEGRSIWRFLLERYTSPTSAKMFDAEGVLVAQMKKGWAFLHPTFRIYDRNDNLIATIRNKFTLINPKSTFFDAQGEPLAELAGNWIAWNFEINDLNGREIATINKQWKGIFSEFLTTADKYLVQISDKITNPSMRTALIMAACTIDLIYKEKQHSSITVQ